MYPNISWRSVTPLGYFIFFSLSPFPPHKMGKTRVVSLALLVYHLMLFRKMSKNILIQ